jgi:group I intron endonuclease
MYLYLFRNEANGKGYVGITVRQVEVRRTEHFGLAKRNGQSAFAKAIRKYGPGAFTMTLLAQADSWEELLRMEQEAIATYNTYAPTGHGYNLTKGGEGSLGRILSEDARQRIAQARTGVPMPMHVREAVSKRHRGVPKPAEQRQKIGDAQRGEKNHRYGKGMDEAHKQKLIAIHTGRVPTEATRAKLSAINKGRTFSAEVREKVRQGALARHARGDTPGIGVPKTPEHRAKIAASVKAHIATHGNAMQGRHHSEETRAKIAASHSGKPLTAEHRAKIAATLKGRPAPALRRATPGRTGMPHSEETKQKMSATARSRLHPLARSIVLDGYVYPSIMEAVRATNYSRVQVQYRLKKGLAHYLDTLEPEVAESIQLDLFSPRKE